MTELQPAASGASPPAPELHDALSDATLDPERPLMWRRTAPGAAEFELVQDEQVFGEMESAGRFGVDAFGECLGRPLELILQPRNMYARDVRVDTREPSDGEPGPFFDGLFYAWGSVTSVAGESLRWRKRFLLSYTNVLRDEEGVELLRLKPAFLRFARMETEVTVQPAGVARADLPELLLLTWFLRAHSDRFSGRVFRRRGNRSRSSGELGPGPDGTERIGAP